MHRLEPQIRPAHNGSASDPQWRERAACRALGDYLFFAPAGESQGMRMRREHAAKQICATCRVLPDCREQVRALGDVHGIWGGLTESERSGKRYLLPLENT